MSLLCYWCCVGGGAAAAAASAEGFVEIWIERKEGGRRPFVGFYKGICLAICADHHYMYRSGVS